MFARSFASRHRRGVVLVVILGMLGLLALIGVMFATFAGQSQIGARKFAEGAAFPKEAEVMDFAMNQLVYDSPNPLSALRGHSLLRDMYGNDARGNGFLGQLPNFGTPLFFMPGGSRPNPTPGPLFGYPQFRINVPATVSGSGNPIPQLYGVNFARWYIRIGAFTSISGTQAVYHEPQTYEILADDDTGSDSFSQGTDPISGLSVPMHLVTLATVDPLLNPSSNTLRPYDAITQNAHNNNTYNSYTYSGTAHFYGGTPVPLTLPLDQDPNGLPIQITLDGRYRRAFNGPGMSALSYFWNGVNPPIPVNAPAMANFRVNAGLLQQFGLAPNQPGIGNPDGVGMDEDYDAVDLENWFLAIQSADGQVVIPSFHRPGILTQQDWFLQYNSADTAANQVQELQAEAKILRPRGIDHPNSSFGALLPDPATGQMTYDVDNDGDGVTDAVWLDLGHHPIMGPSGRMFKPLFAFTVIGLNGRMPLNTAGNLSGRDLSDNNADNLPDSNPTWDHSSHLGYSVSEINPKYALQNAPNPAYSQFDDAGIGVDVTQLRNLLTGTRPQVNPLIPPNQAPNSSTNTDSNFVQIGLSGGTPRYYWMPNNVSDTADVSQPPARATSPIPGRWGEPEGIPTVLPDRTTLPANGGYLAFNNTSRAGVSPGMGPPGFPQYNIDQTNDTYTTFDFWGLFTGTPRNPEDSDHFDLAGFNDLPSERYRRFNAPVDMAGTGVATAWNTFPTPTTPYGTGHDAFGRVAFFRYFRPPGVPVHVDNAGVAQVPVIPDVTTNLYHGFESRRYPLGSNPNGKTPPDTKLPWTMTNGAPFVQDTYPTFVTANHINASDPATGPNGGIVYNGPTGGSIGRDRPDEMDLYDPEKSDAPFGPSDLEWLYRKYDVDGAYLNSRLGTLAPISFTNDIDGTMRGRFFSVDTWETNHLIWANDNPVSMPNHAPTLPSGTPVYGEFPNNSRFVYTANATVQNLDGRALAPYPASPQPTPAPIPVPTYPVAHRDRKINLNFPLPISNDPNEPVRQKWIRETYQTLKAMLPPTAIDTPQELAALSQYVLNIIDFRDPDGTVTRFVNTDLVVTNATKTTPSTLAFNTAPPPAPHFAYDPSFTDPPTGGAPAYLVQYGMEYNPVAINEVLAFSFIRKDPKNKPSNGIPTYRMFVELVNTLTQDAGGTASDLDLNGWNFLIAADDPSGRPDPITGQLPWGTPSYSSGNLPISGTAGTSVTAAGGPALPALGTDDTRPNYYYVVGTATLDSTSETKPPTIIFTNNNILPPKPTAGTGQYYWLYLTRPINPLDPNPTAPTTQTNIVVDTIRFPYIEGGGTGQTDAMGNDTVTPGKNALYSVQRLQPFRGGQMVPMAPGSALPSPPNPYGWSEQLGTGKTSPDQGLYGTKAITLPIYHTLGRANEDDAGNNDIWEYLPLHDRDFTSVAELLLVPGCPPGLFTKKFAEIAPSATFPVSTGYTTPPLTTKPVYPNAGHAFTKDTNGVPIPHSYPYLVDNFYYTAVDPGTGFTPVIGGPTGAGWFKMFDAFEVPSASAGAIGPVAEGQNFDWARQDLRPGLLNLNLIIDEEVFFGLIDDPRLNLNQLANIQVPQVVTQINVNGTPTASYRMRNRGFLPSGGTTHFLKAAFADFLKLRHGGSGFLFAWGIGNTGAPNTTVTPPDPNVAAERPFRSFSYPDVDHTVMRPAALPPSLYSTPAASSPTPYVQDPGVKNPNIAAIGTTNLPPPIPARRLFQLADYFIGGVGGNASNASEPGDPYVNQQTADANLLNPNYDLAQPVAPGSNLLLGGASAGTVKDMRQHPYYRSEWLQKVMNLTTVRTHQYAVWVTVGFFEVVQQGNARLGIPDQLGQEVGLLTGRNIRYRSFFIVDRTKAIGFNSPWPGVNDENFRNCVIYRRKIE